MAFEDETLLELNPTIASAWMPRGVQRENPHTGCEWADECLRNRLLAIRTPQVRCIHERIILIMDNATFHKSRAVTAFLEVHKAEIKPFYLPRYAPKLNEADRRINRLLKNDISRNPNYGDLTTLEISARQYLTNQNKLRDLT